MKVIKSLVEDIEKELDIAECYAKKAFEFKLDWPEVAQTYFTSASIHMDLMKSMHERVVSVISAYRKSNGEPPELMMAIYNYMHERLMEKAAGIKSLMDMYK